MSTFIPSRVTRYYSTKIKNNQDRNLIHVNGSFIPKSDTMFELGEWGQYVDIDTTSHSHRSRCHTYPNRYDGCIKNNLMKNTAVTNNSDLTNEDILKHPLLYIVENMIKPCIFYFDKMNKNKENTDVELMPKVIEHQYQTKKLRQSIYSIDEEAEEEEFVNKKEHLKMNPCHMVFVSTISMSAVCIFMLW